MSFTLIITLLTIALVAAMLGLIEAGRYFATWRAKTARETGAPLISVESAVFGLVALILGFTFSGALSSFEAERRSIGQEANAINSVWERLDLLRAEERRAIQTLMMQYIDLRLEEFRQQRGSAAAEVEFNQTTELQDKIWQQSVAACRSSGLPQSFTVLLPAISQMSDVSQTRHLAVHIHPPTVIPGMLAFLMLICSLLAGYSMVGKKSRSWLHISCFIISIALAVFVITDLEFPYFGLFRVDKADYQQLLELRNKFSHQISAFRVQDGGELARSPPLRLAEMLACELSNAQGVVRSQGLA